MRSGLSRSRYVALWVVILGLSLGLPTRAAAYAFTLIADDTGPFSFVAPISPSINAAGTVAFHSRLDAGGDGIFVGTGAERGGLHDASYLPDDAYVATVADALIAGYCAALNS